MNFDLACLNMGVETSIDVKKTCDHGCDPGTLYERIPDEY